MGIQACWCRYGRDVDQEDCSKEEGRKEVDGKEVRCEEDDYKVCKKACEENCGPFRKEEVSAVAGAIVLVLVLLAFPIVVGLSTAALAGLLGHFLWKDGEVRHEGSELIDTNV